MIYSFNIIGEKGARGWICQEIEKMYLLVLSRLDD
jgi:hypothetical protein